MCSTPPDVDNGTLIITTPSEDNLLVVGSVISYNCESGFAYNSGHNHTCLSNGIWSGKSFGYCRIGALIWLIFYKQLIELIYL